MAGDFGASRGGFVYGPDDKPRSARDAVVYSLQWLLIMFYPVVWGYSIVGANLGFTADELSAYMSRVVLMIGLSTLIQVLAGHRLAMVSGPNIIPSLAILAAFSTGGREEAVMAFNASIVAGVIVAILGFFGLFRHFEKIWTPLALGTMVMMIGLATSTMGVELIVGGGASWPAVVGVLLALMCGWLSIQGKGMLATIPVMLAIVIGYLVFIATGRFDWGIVHGMPVLAVPALLPYGWEMPRFDLIVTMTIISLFAAVNLYGNANCYAGIIGRPLDAGRERRYFVIFGLLEGAVCSLFGVPGHIAYGGESVGLLLLTRIAARIFLVVAAVAAVVLSFSGKFGGLMAAMPREVAGAVLLGVASTLIGLGAGIWTGGGRVFHTREIFITGFSVFLAFGLSRMSDEFYRQVPDLLAIMFRNPVIMVIILVILLEQVVFPKKRGDASSA